MADQMGSELLARQMVNEGVVDLFYIMGGPIIEAAGFAAEHGIRTIDCRHEAGGGDGRAMGTHASSDCPASAWPLPVRPRPIC